MAPLPRPPSVSPEAHAARWRATGDPQAFGALFDTTAGVLFRVAVTLVPDAATAEDVLQQTFTVALKKLARLDAGRPVMPWLLNVLQKEAARARRRARRTPDPLRLPARPPPPEPGDAARGADVEAVRGAIESLEEPYRSAALLRWKYGLAPSEIAHVRGEPPGTTRSLLSRALERLKRGAPALPVAFFGDARVPRGLGGVRSSVITQATTWGRAAGLGTAAAVLGGGLLVKKTILAAVILIALAGGWALWRVVPEAERVRVGESAPPAAPSTIELAAEPEGNAKARAARAAAAAPPSVPLVEGRVLDEDGKPVADAFVVVHATDRRTFVEGDSRHPDPTVSLASTGRDGRFALPMPDVPRGLALVLAKGYAAGSIDDVVPGRLKDLVLRRAGRAHGRVLDGKGRPIAGARVRWLAILGAFHTQEDDTTSDASGAWHFDSVSSLGTKVVGGAKLVVDAEGYARQILDPNTELRRDLAQLPLDLELDVVLSRGARVEGHVVLLDGTAAGGAHVVLWTMDGDLWIWGADGAGPAHPARLHLLGELTADPEGRFVFEHAPSKGFHDVRQEVTSLVTGRKVGAWCLATKPGFTTAIGEVALVEEGGRVPLEMRIRPAFSVEGRVVDGEGKPVAAAQVWASVLREGLMVGVPEDLRAAFPTEGAYSAADGSYRIDGVQVPLATEPPFGMGAASTRSVLANGERDSTFFPVPGPYEGLRHMPDLVLKAHPLPFARVRVLDEQGRPIPDAHLGFSPAVMSFRTDAEGRARVEWYSVVPASVGLPPQHLVVRATGFAMASPLVALAREAGDVPEEVVVRLRQGHRLAGVVTPEGGPLPEGTRVYVGDGRLTAAQAFPWAFPGHAPEPVPEDSLQEYGSVAVGPDGTFELSGLPDGPYCVLVYWQPRSSNPIETPTPVLATRPDVPADARDVSVVFHVPPAVPTRDVDLRVVDADTGEPALRPWGELITVGTSMKPLHAYGRRFAPGILRFARVVPGGYRFYGGAEGYVMTTVDSVVIEAADGAPLPVVKVRHGARIVGKVTAPDGGPLKGRVMIEPYDSSVGKMIVTVDANGAFEASGLPPGRYLVTAVSGVVPDFASYAGDPVPLVDVAADSTEIRLDGAWVVAGTVHVMAKGVRFVGASPQGLLTAAQVADLKDVVFDVADSSGRLVHHRAGFTPSDVRIEFAGRLPPGTYLARLSIPGEPVRERRFEVVAGKKVEVTLE